MILNRFALYVFLFISNLSFSQDEIGLTYNEVNKVIEKEKIALDKINRANGSIYVNYPKFTKYWYIQNNICTSHLIVPNSDQDLADLYDLYNSKYTVRGTNVWSFIDSRGNSIAVVYSKSYGGFYFMVEPKD